MITITITQDSLSDRMTSQAGISIDGSEDVRAIEVSAMWERIRSGGLEGNLKSSLERFCTERGFNAAELLSQGDLPLD